MIMIFINMLCISFFVMGIPDMIRNLVDLKKKGSRIYDPILKILECYKCTTFFVVLFFTLDFFFACQLSGVAFFIDKYIISRY